MSFSIFNKNFVGKNNSIDDSRLAKTQFFRIKSFDNAFKTTNKINSWLNQNDETITGVALEPINYSFSHSWVTAEGAQIVNLIQKFSRVTDGNNSYAMIGSRHEYITNSATDAWTQQKMKETSPLSVNIKFRVFHEKYANTGNYVDIIRFFSCITSAHKEFSLQNEFDNMKSTLGLAAWRLESLSSADVDYYDNKIRELEKEKEKADDAGYDKEKERLEKEIKDLKDKRKTVKKTNETDRKKYGDTGTKLIGVVNALHMFLKGTDNENDYRTHARGNFTVSLKTNMFSDKYYKKIDWYISSWNFKPSMQYEESDNKPLWVDFNVSLTTTMALSYDTLCNLFGYKSNYR